MTKNDCDIVQDLLPLYLDGCCHPGSRALVEEHLNHCDTCRKVWEEMSGELPKPEEVPPASPSSPSEEEPEQKRGKHFQKGMKKIRRRWIASLIAVALLIPLVKMGINEVTGDGVSYSNLHELYLAHAFLNRMKSGDYEGAAAYLNLEDTRERFLFSWFTEEEMENYDQDAVDTFVEAAQEIQAQGGISSCHFRLGQYASAYQCSESLDGTPIYRFDFDVTIGDDIYVASIEVGTDGVESCWFSIPGALNVPESLNKINSWSYTLWNDYIDRYFDEERKSEYVCFND